MPKAKPKNPDDFIVPLNMNGLQGRMLYLPPPRNKTKQILIIYGHHASIERMFGLAEDLNKYGGVTMPDLPGFGGMQSFYTIGEKPTLDNMADYLAAFIKMRYKRRKVSILAMSFGFAVVTRMLQRYPELTDRVEILISIVGFAHHEDFKFKRSTYLLFRYISSIFSNRLPAWFAQHVVLRPFIIRSSYLLVADGHSKLKDADKEERDARIAFEIILWQINDLRTYMDTGLTMLKLDICNNRVDLPLYHISVANDRYFDAHVVEQHLNVIFSSVEVCLSKMPAHAPTVVADAKASAPLVPRRIRKLLSS